MSNKVVAITMVVVSAIFMLGVLLANIAGGHERGDCRTVAFEFSTQDQELRDRFLKALPAYDDFDYLSSDGKRIYFKRDKTGRDVRNYVNGRPEIFKYGKCL